MDYSIEICDLTKRFPREPNLVELIFKPFRRREYVTAVENVTLQAKKGEVFGLLGPNGAGKTTLIKRLCNIIMPTNRSAPVGGYDLLEEGERVRGSIGLVTNGERSFFWRLTGRRNLEFFGSLYNLSSRVVEERVVELLRRFSLAGKADDILGHPSTRGGGRSLRPRRVDQQRESRIRRKRSRIQRHSISCQDAWVSGLGWMSVIRGVENASGAPLIRRHWAVGRFCGEVIGPRTGNRSRDARRMDSGGQAACRRA